MRRVVAVAVLLLVGGASHAAAQGGPLWGWLKIRQSVTDKTKAAKPASVLVEWPHAADAVYAIDAGFSGNALRGSTVWALEPTFELHKHSAIKKPQDTLLAGLTVSRLFGDPVRSANYLDGSFEFKHDRVAGTRGVQAALSWLPLRPAAAIGASRGSPNFRYRWQPSLALEVEDIAQAPAGDPTGHVVRSEIGLDVSIFPGAARFQNRLEITVGGRVWSEFTKSAALGSVDRGIPLGTFSLTGFVDRSRHFGVGLERVHGIDVSQNLLHQQYWQFALKILY